jgi:hypothetical protein
MPKITSRPSSGQEAQDRIEALQDLLDQASCGAIGDMSAGAVVQAEDTLDGLIDQTAVLLASMAGTIEGLALQASLMTSQLVIMAARLDIAEDALANLIGNIDYDECMDHATTDLMESMTASGKCDVDDYGNLVFSERAVFSKADMKPVLREAIVSWVEKKMSQ